MSEITTEEMAAFVRQLKEAGFDYMFEERDYEICDALLALLTGDNS